MSDCLCVHLVSPQKTIDSRVPMKKISSSKWFLWATFDDITFKLGSCPFFSVTRGVSLSCSFSLWILISAFFILDSTSKTWSGWKRWETSHISFRSSFSLKHQSLSRCSHPSFLCSLCLHALVFRTICLRLSVHLRKFLVVMSLLACSSQFELCMLCPITDRNFHFALSKVMYSHWDNPWTQ